MLQNFYMNEISTSIDKGRSVLDSRLSSLNICHYHLSKLLNFKIEWVNSMCEHLDFNPKKKSLELFQYPSFCDDYRGILWKLFRVSVSLYHKLWNNISDHRSGFSTTTLSMADTENATPKMFLLNFSLCTFRVVFGQDRRSQRHAGPTNENVMQRGI